MMLLRGSASTLVNRRRTKNSFARVAVAAFVLLAFTFQTYIAQTHIHLARSSFASESELGAAKKQQPDKFPAQDDPANCPICQEILHSGQFVTPSAAATLLPSLAVSIIAIVTHILAVPRTASHTWQSRGPPRH